MRPTWTLLGGGTVMDAPASSRGQIPVTSSRHRRSDDPRHGMLERDGRGGGVRPGADLWCARPRNPLPWRGSAHKVEAEVDGGPRARPREEAAGLLR